MMTTSNKRKYGQFFSTNSEDILRGFEKPSTDYELIDPFTGKGDLVRWLGRSTIEYDIEPQRERTSKRDTLRNPPSYSGRYVVTHPPFLARNKSSDKTLYEMFGQNDLFKIFITQLCRDPPVGGILILPVNFWSSCRDADIELRTEFMKIFRVLRVNIFEEPVFQDTTCAVCAFQFSHEAPNVNVPFRFFPSKEERNFIFHDVTNYTIGWDIISLMNDSYKHTVERSVKRSQLPNTHLMLRALDNIGLVWVDEPSCGKKSSRTFANLIINPPITKTRQRRLLEQFNNFVVMNRDKYQSMWLSNYREGARKRMGFEMAYSIISYLLTI